MTTFQHKDIDAQCLMLWREKSVTQRTKGNEKSFNMIFPIANITGTMHLGHALTITIQDMMTRYHRMKGDNVTWIPGTDHAGIATQVVVEKQLYKDTKQTRHDLGREKFLEKVWEWKEKNGNTISNQMRTMCPLIDYDLEQFTMSPELSKAVIDAFIKLYESKLIYRDLRMVDFCCNLKTVISNIEVDEIEINEPTSYTTPNGIKVDLGLMYWIKYQICKDSLNPEQQKIIDDNKIDSVIVSTTRPETMFGDVAVAVNPMDHRFYGLENIKLIIPLTEIQIPLIYDEQAKIDMGSGAVKITPSHDPKDWACYQRCKDRYQLTEHLEVIDDDGNMRIPEGQEDVYGVEGKDRYICRKIVLKKLKETGYLVDTLKHKTTVRTCSRSRDILEPKLKKQWYIDTEDMSRRSIEAVESGELRIIPDPDSIHRNTWKRFLSEGRSWCISRQLWWGHRIPGYRIIMSNASASNENEEWIVTDSYDKAVTEANARYPDKKLGTDYQIAQDEDVLDTWFSSGLYPFTVLNGKYFPLDILETGKDILFFWVARMVMLSLALKNVLPFKTVYLHNIVRDKDGKKMSKSLGNIIDPLDIIYGISRPDMEARIKNSNLDEKEIHRAIQNIKTNFPNGIADHGVDSLRMGLCHYLKQGTDINLDPQIFKSTHALLNKLWNVMMMYCFYAKVNKNEEKSSVSLVNDDNNANTDNTIHAIQEIQQYIDILSDRYLDYNLYEDNNFSMLYENIHQYVMNNYCPFYLEAIKFVLTDKKYQGTKLVDKTLIHMLESFKKILIYLYPIAPNATETMFKKLTGESITYVRPKLNLKSDKFFLANKTDSFCELRIIKIRAKIGEINSNKQSQNDDDDETICSFKMYQDLISFMTRTHFIV